MDRARLDAYFQRLRYGVDHPDLPTATALLHAHLESIPFETLDPYAGAEVSLAPDAIAAKLIAGGRGGYCYEHNLLFGDALRALGYEVTDLAARVRWLAPPEVARGRTHMLLAVHIDGRPWLFDAGFGGQPVHAPLPLDEPAPTVATAHGALRLAAADGPEGERLLQWHDAAGWRDLYRFDRQPQQRVDYELTSWFLGHHPASSFRTTLMAARCLPGGARDTLRNALYSERAADGTRRSTRITTPDALAAVLTERFGLALEGPAALPAAQLRAALQRAVDSTD